MSVHLSFFLVLSATFCITLTFIYLTVIFDISLYIRDLYSTEHKSTRLTDRSQETLQTCTPELLHAATVDGEHPQSWCELPDVDERQAGKFTTPTAGSPATA